MNSIASLGFVLLWTLLFVCSGDVDAKAAKTKTRAVPEADSENEISEPKVVEIAQGEAVGQKCSPYGYCDGTKFPASTSVMERDITCDQVPNPRDTCCLNTESHYVCYNIQVSGVFLNYNPSEPGSDTDFTELCRLLVPTQNVTMGKYTSITRATGGGQVAYRYGEFEPLSDSTGGYHIRDLACGVHREIESS